MDGVVERAAFDVDVGGLFEERDEPRGCPRHPRLGKPLVVERRHKELEDVPSGTEAGKDIGGGAGTLEEVDREAAVGLLVAAGMALLADPISQLAELYGGSFALRPLGAIEVIVLSSAGAFLGWLGAQLSVSLSLRKFD